MAKKLFELLVVEKNLKAQAQATRAESRNTFEKKRHLFESKLTTFTPSEPGAPAITEAQSDIQSDVMKELRWLCSDIWAKQIDTSFHVAHGNVHAKADVVLDDDTVLAHDVPATALLELEKRVTELHELLLVVPTLDPAKGFTVDSARGDGIFSAREVVKRRTKKIEDYIVVVPATVEHPAQVAKVSKDVDTGTITEQEWSGLITPARKSQLLARTDALRRAFKAALHRANAVEMPASLPSIAKTMFDYVLA